MSKSLKSSETVVQFMRQCKRFKPWLYTVFLVGLTAFLIDHLGVLPVRYRLTTEKCIEVLGCYSIDGEFSSRPFNVLPQDRSDINTKFVLYTSPHVSDESLFGYEKVDQLRSKLDFEKDFIFLIHGWFTMRDEPVLVHLLQALLDTKFHSHNVLLVDWSSGSLRSYPRAASNTRVVGAEIAKLLHYLQAIDKTVPARTHLIGISLGAHISGYCGALVPGLGRITALDAAGPLFEHYPAEVRLDPSDAEFVDAIHTDGDDFYMTVFMEGGLGIDHSIGHADFYPHGGHSQPYCYDVFRKVKQAGHIFDKSLVRNIFACDHELALNYFARSLYDTRYHSLSCINNHHGYVMGQCHDYNLMGYDARKPATNSKYYLHMDDDELFEGHHYQVTLEVELSSHDPVCLQFVLEGTQGFASHVERAHYNRSCSTSLIQTALMFSESPVGELKFLYMKVKSQRPLVVIKNVAVWYFEKGHRHVTCNLEQSELTADENQEVSIKVDKNCDESSMLYHLEHIRDLSLTSGR